MSDETQVPKPGPQQSSGDDVSATQPQHAAPEAPEQVGSETLPQAEPQEGVKTDLVYTEDQGGVRTYPAQGSGEVKTDFVPAEDPAQQ